MTLELDPPPSSTPLREASPTREEPIAIVGIGCRFPGDVDGPDAYWELLATGRDAVTEVPSDRWDIRTYYAAAPATPGRTASKWGGFIKNLDLFDASFFDMSPREAACVDPQHRLLLELAWEALEDAGLPPDRLRGSRTGVFVGISTQDYGFLQQSGSARPTIDAYTNVGGAMCMAANRISYAYDLHGPSLVVDTACSSSLVALHLACEALRRGDCPTALVAGANAIFRPESTIGFSQASMLSPTGRCRSFDADADGYVRAEGGAVAVLKPLSRARHDGDRVYAVIRGTAVNHDGRTNGISLPNGEAQAAMLRQACASAGIRPSAIQYMEAHGTGTPVGDPIEARAIGSVLGEGRPPHQACWMGSVKSNIGHLEAAAGMAGLIKVALSLRHAQIPPTLHFVRGNPHIDFDGLRLRVPTALEPWHQPQEGRRIGAVNSFGFGGANAHAVLEEAPDHAHPVPQTAADESALLVPCSARSPEALSATAAAWASSIERRDMLSLPAIARSAALHRAHHEYRLAVSASSTGELARRLRDHAAGRSAVHVAAGRTRPTGTNATAFVFSGMGPQWWGMGRGLLASSPLFARVIRECDELFSALAGWSLWRELTSPEEDSRMARTSVAQPAMFALQMGLLAQWRHYGVEPALVVGHSLGEVAAACAAGALTLEDAVTVVFHRSRLQQTLAGQGGMAAVGLPPEEIEPLLAAVAGKVSIAAVNSPRSVTLAGEEAALTTLLSRLGSDVFCRRLAVEVPYHSPCMAAIREELEDSLRHLKPRASQIPMVSTVTGALIRGEDLTAGYWWRNVREPVQFARAMIALDELGMARVVEVGPHPALFHSLVECFPADRSMVVAHSLHKSTTDGVSLLDNLARLWTDGQPVTWENLCPPGPERASLPSYPWQREHFWRESVESRQGRLGLAVHPLLGNRTATALPTWSVPIDVLSLPYLADHLVHEAVVYPGAAYVEMGLAAARQIFGESPLAVEDVRFEKVNILPAGAVPTAQVVFDPKTSAFEVFSLAEGAADAWVRHAAGKIRRLSSPSSPAARLDRDHVRARCAAEKTREECYRRFRQLGLCYGPTFRGIERIWCGPQEALAEIHLPEALLGDASEYWLHPALFDACLQVIVGALAPNQRADEEDGATYLPVRVDSIRVWRPLRDHLWCHAVAHVQDRDGQLGDVSIYDDAGELLVEVRGIASRRLGVEHARWRDPAGELVYREQWLLQPLPGGVVEVAAPALVGPTAIAAQLAPEVARLIEDLGRRRYYDDLEPRGNALAIAYVLNAFQKLGGGLEIGGQVTVDSLMNRMRVDPSHRRYLRRLLLILETEGILTRRGDGFDVAKLPPAIDLAQAWTSWSDWGDFAPFFAERRLVRRCGERLAEVLTGEQNPLELLFPEGGLDSAEHLYQDSPTYRIYNHLAQAAVSAALAKLPVGARVRILEIGGGTGGMTAHVLAGLPAQGCSYRFTDVSAAFLAPAERKLSRYPFVEYGTLDLEGDLSAQGYESDSFDLILASDVLHATADLRRSLASVRSLLAPSGLFVLLEGSRAPYWATMFFGMLKGWWAFTDRDLRAEDPWVPRSVWEPLLQEAGFPEVACLTDREDDDALHNVLLARVPARDPRPALSTVPEPATSSARQWLIFADEGTLADQLAERLEAAGHTALLDRGASSREAFRDALAHVSGPLRGVVYLRGATLPDLDDVQDSLASQDEASIGLVLLVGALTETGLRPAPRLWVATRGARAVDLPVGVAALTQAPLWGVGRVVLNEAPELQCTLVDLSSRTASDSDATAAEIGAFVAELCAETEEREVALRGTLRYVQRLLRERPVKMAPWRSDVSFQIGIDTPGILSSLRIQETPRRPPGANEVEVRVAAACLNFKDVAVAMGLLPDEAFAQGYTGRALGVEAAGEITAIGSGVAGLALGDQVVCFAPHALASHVTLDAALAILRPEQVALEDAVGAPVAFATAHHSLHHLARLARGETVLIHAAAGGVGLAAVQLATLIGAEVFATAGSAEKRDFLRAIGVHHVFDSRSLDFVDEVRRATGGRGVDVVLNSLAGDALAGGVGLLAHGGRFIEIGKQDIYSGGRLALRDFSRNNSFFAVDLDGLMRDQPARVGRLTREVFEMMEQGRLEPLPYRVFSLDRASDAFKHMAQAKHIGRVILSRLTGAALRVDPVPAGLRIDPHGTYLITGGLSGFGLETARWLVRLGARSLVLVGRRGASTPQIQAAVEALRTMGAHVVAAAADVADPQALGRVLTDLRRDLPPLRGVIHAAMVLDDGFLPQLDRERMRRVLAPKMAGAWNLHLQTLDDPIDFFVLYSSMTAVLGTPGQANYAAGNAFLDALASYRQGQGLPATSVNWGVVSNVGYVAEGPELTRNMMDRLGAHGVPAQVLLDMLSVLIQARLAHACVADVTWTQVAATTHIGQSPLVAHLASVAGTDAPSAPPSQREALLATEGDQRSQLVEELLKVELAKVLGTSAGRIDLQRPLLENGLDSLMAFELKSRLESVLGISVSPMLLMQGATTEGLARILADELSGAGPSTGRAPSTPVLPATRASLAVVRAQVDALSDVEVEALLGEELARERTTLEPRPKE